jgi:hypothetical protein
MFDPKEFLLSSNNEDSKFDENFDKKGFGVDCSDNYVVNVRKWLDEKNIILIDFLKLQFQTLLMELQL